MPSSQESGEPSPERPAKEKDEVTSQSEASPKITENYVVITPAYGRDYHSAIEAGLAFKTGKDFQMADVRYGGTYCSTRDFAKGVKVCVRYSKLRKVMTVVAE